MERRICCPNVTICQSLSSRDLAGQMKEICRNLSARQSTCLDLSVDRACGCCRPTKESEVISRVCLRAADSNLDRISCHSDSL